MVRRPVFLFVLLLLPLGTLFAGVPIARAETMPSFSDVSQSREEFIAVEDLQRRGIIQGRPNGTFGPDDAVNRAEAVTIVVRAVANVRNLPPAVSRCFPDVAEEDWFVRAVCYAKDLAWIAGYPDGTFQPVRTVAKGEFLKILLHAYGVDTAGFEQWHDPLAPDARDSTQWYFPYIAYALASSMTRADSEGNLRPGAALTRGQVALLLHRFLLYREGERDQALLTAAEKDIRFVFEKLDALAVTEAEYAVARVRVLAWGAERRLPTSAIVRATTTVGEALQTLTRAYMLVQQGQLSPALSAAQGAYRLADQADGLHADVRLYTDKVRSAAHTLADAIREHQ